MGNTQKWERSSLSFNATYINLAPYLAVFKDRNEWETPYQGAQGEMVYRYRLNNGMLKFYAAFDTAKFQLTQEDINLEDGLDFKLNKSNLILSIVFNFPFYNSLGAKKLTKIENSWDDKSYRYG